jgi:hypothetical protein
MDLSQEEEAAVLSLLTVLRNRYGQEIISDREMFQALNIQTMTEYMEYETDPEMSIYQWWIKRDPELLKKLYYRESTPGQGERLREFLRSQEIQDSNQLIEEVMQEYSSLPEEEQEAPFETREHLEMMATHYPMELMEMKEQKTLIPYLLDQANWWKNPDYEDPENFRGNMAEDRFYMTGEM